MPTRARLTPKEVAAFADVPVSVVEKAIEDHLLPVHREAAVSNRPRRLLDPWSVAYVAVTGRLKGRLTAADKRAFSRRLGKAKPEEIERGHWEIVPALTVDVGRLVGDRMSRASRYCSARDRHIAVNEDIKGGTPIIRGTRMAHPPRDIDVMLMEGSSLGRLDPDKTFPTEAEVESRFVDLFRQTPGMALVAASAQNIDRMVSLYRACKRAGRTLVIDLYAAEVLRATGNPNIPQSDWPNVAVYVPQYQRVRIKQTGRFDLLDAHKARRIFPEDLKALAPEIAFLFRPAMLPDLDRAECLAGARAIWSQWDGYLKAPTGEKLAAALDERGIAIEHAHTSGHASLIDLKRLAATVAPKRLVPIHTFEPASFPAHFDNVSLQHDGQWWGAAA